MPMRGVLPVRPIGCCAPATTGHAAAAPPSSVMNSRRFTSNFSRASKRKIALLETYCTAGFPRSLCPLWVIRAVDHQRESAAMSALPPKADKWHDLSTCPLCADCVAKVFLAFGRETLIQDRARTSNNDSKEPTHRFDCYKFLFHRACLATFATVSARSGREHGYSITASARASNFQNGRFLSSQWFPTNQRPRKSIPALPSVVLNQIGDLWSPSTFHRARDRRSSCRILAGFV